jgi:Periplasmic binding protein
VRRRVVLAPLICAVALLPGCTAGDDSAADTESGAPAEEAPAATGPAPGVTDDSVAVGITYVDLASLGDIVSLDHGDYETAYRAVIDDINADGGINGRTIEPVFAPINPVGTQPAEAACLQLTEDEEAFIVIGFFLDDGPLCYLETHETAVIGGSMTPERLERAQAPWFTAESGTDLQSDVVRVMADGGELDGALGVFARPGEEAQMNDIVLPLLDELGVDVVESAVIDAPPDDTAATNAATQVIAQRFESAGVDQVLLIGTAGLVWASGVESTDYRPQLLLTDPNSILAYINDAAGRDLSVLDGAVSGSLYGGAANIYDLPAMQECVGVVEDAGGVVDDPGTAAPDAAETWVSAFNACTNVTLLRSLLEAAGDDLNYGTLAAGADGLEVELPNDPDVLTYGPPPAADGDRPAYLYDWDPDEVDFVLRED